MRLCVIGDPVGHSLSPRIHRRFMERCGAAGSYEAMTVTAETLEDFVAQGRRGAWDGCNVTMPLKERILPLLDAVDAGTLKFVPTADFISHLSEKEQTYLLLVMERDEVSPSLGQAQRLKQLSGEGKLETNIIDLIMREEKPLERKVTIRNDRLQKYFPASYTPKQMEDVIIKLLEGWHRKRQQEQSR